MRTLGWLIAFCRSQTDYSRIFYVRLLFNWRIVVVLNLNLRSRCNWQNCRTELYFRVMHWQHCTKACTHRRFTCAGGIFSSLVLMRGKIPYSLSGTQSDMGIKTFVCYLENLNPPTSLVELNWKQLVSTNFCLNRYDTWCETSEPKGKLIYCNHWDKTYIY